MERNASALFLEAVNKRNEKDDEAALALLHQATEVAKAVDEMHMHPKIFNLMADIYGSQSSSFAGRGEEIVFVQKAIQALQREKQFHALQKDKEAEASTIHDICQLIASITPSSEDLQKHYQEATTLARDCDNKDLLCVSLRKLGEFHLLRARNFRREFTLLTNAEETAKNELRTAISHYEEAYEIARESFLSEHIGFLAGDLANAYYEIGQYDQAKALYFERLNIAEAKTDRPAMRRAYGAIGNINRAMGQITQATMYYRLALAVAVELNDMKAITLHFMALGEMSIEDANWNEGAMYLNRAIETARISEDLSAEIKAYQGLAQLHLVRLEFAKAAYCFAVCRKLAKMINRQDLVIQAHEQLQQIKSNCLEDEDGIFVIDSSDDPQPRRNIALTSSLTSIDLNFESPDVRHSLDINTATSSQSFHTDDGRHDSFFDQLDRLARWKFENSRVELQPNAKSATPRSFFRRTSLMLKQSLNTPRNLIRDFSFGSFSSKKHKAVLQRNDETKNQDAPLLNISPE